MSDSELAMFVWKNKYQGINTKTGIMDVSIADTWQRVVDHVFPEGEEEDECKRKALLDALNTYKLLPGGRILAGSGTPGIRTLVNTFVIDRLNGCPHNTLNNLDMSARTMRAGGGIGCNLSDIPPRGSPLPGGGVSPGILAVMQLWNEMCASVMSSGAQRGAMMMVIDCTHPELLEFIDAKQAQGRLAYMNISVLISDVFMESQQTDSEWTLEFNGVPYRKIKARELWNRILQRAYEGAEPGVIFIDKILDNNNLGRGEDIVATNSCAEQPLPKHGSAALASINFAKLVNLPFTSGANIDISELRKLVRLGVLFLENVVDVTHYPFECQRLQALHTRRIGLGLTGLGDALSMCNVRYGSPESLSLIERWMNEFTAAAYEASCELSQEKGACMAFDYATFSLTKMAQQLPEQIIKNIRQYGLRHGSITTIAPTGSISILAGNVSSGIEPTFAHRVQRIVRDAEGRENTLITCSYSSQRYHHLHGDTGPLPDFMVTASEISPYEHLVVQATVQRFIDAGISKTVNFPVATTFEDFMITYDLAFGLGCKSVSGYVPNVLRGSILRSLDLPDESQKHERN